MENKNKFKNIKFTMHKLTSISLIQQWHSTKHFKMFLCLSCPLLVELRYYLTRDLKKLHIKVDFLLNVCVCWNMRVVFRWRWAAIPRAVILLQLPHLNMIWTTCLSSQQVEHVISHEERLTHGQNIIRDSIAYNLSENTSHFRYLKFWHIKCK